MESLLKNMLIYPGVPGRIRTADLPLRRGLRYPSVPPGRETKDTLNKDKLQKNLHEEQIVVNKGAFRVHTKKWSAN